MSLVRGLLVAIQSGCGVGLMLMGAFEPHFIGFVAGFHMLLSAYYYSQMHKYRDQLVEVIWERLTEEERDDIRKKAGTYVEKD